MHATTTNESFGTTSQARVFHDTGVSVDQMRARLTRALGREGFSVLAETDVADLLGRQLDTALEPYFILEICHPHLAQRALAVASDAGLLLSSQLCVWKEGNGAAVAVLPPDRLAAALGREHLDEVARELGERLDQVFGVLGVAVPEPKESPMRAARRAIEVDEDELAELREAVHRHVQELTVEAAGTESRPLQHELARSIERLEQIAQRLDLESRRDDPDPGAQG